MPIGSDTSYLDWVSLPSLFPRSYPRVKTSRDSVLVDTENERLIERLNVYFDPRMSAAEIRRLILQVMDDTAQFDRVSTALPRIARLPIKGVAAPKVILSQKTADAWRPPKRPVAATL
jgi:hypothetical protein